MEHPEWSHSRPTHAVLFHSGNYLWTFASNFPFAFKRLLELLYHVGANSEFRIQNSEFLFWLLASGLKKTPTILRSGLFWGYDTIFYQSFLHNSTTEGCNRSTAGIWFWYVRNDFICFLNWAANIDLEIQLQNFFRNFFFAHLSQLHSFYLWHLKTQLAN